MSIAAVPDYLGNDFSQASPGMRFGLFFAFWQSDFSKGDKVPALKRVGTLTLNDKNVMQAIAERQRSLTKEATDVFTIDAVSTSPFATGLGNEHPLENGFAFLNPYGLPYLPGTSIKGVLRQAARELASGDWGDPHGWTLDCTHRMQLKGGRAIELSPIDALFGLESTDGGDTHLRGALNFWDCIPQIKGESLSVDIMTPHLSHYYQPNKDRKSSDSNTPHDSGKPNPIPFLTVPPGTGFMFQVRCDPLQLEKAAPHLGKADQWKHLLAAAFAHAFDWLGFGAKTAVGYGAMQINPEVRARLEKDAAERLAQAEREERERQRETELGQLSPVDRAIRECLDARKDPNLGEIPALRNAIKAGLFPAEMKRDIALHIRSLMQAAKKWKETTQAKKPEKDGDYQDTLLIKSWIDETL